VWRRSWTCALGPPPLDVVVVGGGLVGGGCMPPGLAQLPAHALSPALSIMISFSGAGSFSLGLTPMPPAAISSCLRWD